MPRYLARLYVQGNIHIALCAVALTLTTQLLFGLTVRNELLVFIFCGTLFGYNLQRLPRTRHLVTISALSAIAFVWAASRLYLRSQVTALVPAALSFAYAFPVIPVGRKWIQLREIPGLKIFIIAITWTCSCVLLPFASDHHGGEPWFSSAAILWAAACGLMIFALTIPFDIRDLRSDARELKTLPAMVGTKRAIRLALAALLASALLLLLVGTTAQVTAYVAWCAIAALFIWKSTPERHEYYFTFAIDGLLLLLWGMVRISTAI